MIWTLHLPSGQRLFCFIWTSCCESTHKEEGYRTHPSSSRAISIYEFKLGICITEFANPLSSKNLSLTTLHSLKDLGEAKRLEVTDLAK